MTADLTEAIGALRRRNKPVQRPARLPTEAEVASAEHATGRPFPADYRRYLLEASDVVFGTLEPWLVTPGAGYLDLEQTARRAWDAWGVPREWLPFCEDNADFYCLDSSIVRFWSHDGTTKETWPTSQRGSWTCGSARPRLGRHVTFTNAE